MAILRRTTGGSPLEALVRLFLAEEPVDEKIARVALAPLTPAQWADGGLVETDGERVRGSVRLRSFERAAGGRAIMASDSWGTKEQAPDHVLGIGSASLGLSHITIRRPVSRTLDLGTGGGVQAMDAALHSESVVATDRNPRAVNFARFNLALNNVPNVEVRQGDLFEPVGGDLFGLIVSNPPFVISPESALLYRDNPMEGDEFCQLLVRTAAQHLTEGGWCQLLAGSSEWGRGSRGLSATPGSSRAKSRMSSSMPSTGYGTPPPLLNRRVRSSMPGWTTTKVLESKR